MKAIWDNLRQILDTMDIPEDKKGDLNWLSYHIRDKNAEHPELGVAIHFIETLNVLNGYKMDSVGELANKYNDLLSNKEKLEAERNKAVEKEKLAHEYLGRCFSQYQQTCEAYNNLKKKNGNSTTTGQGGPA